MGEEIREEFEAAYAERSGCNIDELKSCRWGDKGYRDPFAAAAWFGWIDSRAALAIELPDTVTNTGTLTSNAVLGYKKECRAAIEAAGIKVNS